MAYPKEDLLVALENTMVGNITVDELNGRYKLNLKKEQVEDYYHEQCEDYREWQIMTM